MSKKQKELRSLFYEAIVAVTAKPHKDPTKKENYSRQTSFVNTDTKFSM